MKHGPFEGSYSLSNNLEIQRGIKNNPCMVYYIIYLDFGCFLNYDVGKYTIP